MTRAHLLTLAAVIGWAFGPVGSKLLLTADRDGSHPGPLQVAFWAISAGWLWLAAVLVARGRLRRLRDFAPGGWAVLVAMGFFGWAGYAVALNYAFAHLELPDAIIINYLHPVFTVVLQGRAFSGAMRCLTGWERPAVVPAKPQAARIAAGLFLSLAGVGVIATGGKLAGLGQVRDPAAVGAAVFAAVSWGLYSNLGRFVRPRSDDCAQATGGVQTFCAMSFGVIMMGTALLASGGVASPLGYGTWLHVGGGGTQPVAAWGVAAAMGLLVYCGGFTSWLIALEVGRASGIAHKLPPLTYLTPVLAVLLSRLVLHSPFGPGFWQGAALIATGNLLIALGRPKG